MDKGTTRMRTMWAAFAAITVAFAMAVAIAIPQSAHAAEDSGVWDRLYGDNALETMAKVVDEGWDKSDVVVLSTIDTYHDALTAAGIAGMADDAPVLMTESTTLSKDTEAVLGKLKPKTILVCGGTESVSDAVAKAAVAAAGEGAEYVRLSGDNAPLTACDIFAKAKDLTGQEWSTSAFVATSGTYHDALAAAPVSYATHMPIFLTTGVDEISDATLKAMKDGGIKEVYIAGGEFWISDAVVKQIEAQGITVKGRLSGDTSVETSQKISEFGLEHGLTANEMGVATTKTYHDALTGAALCGKLGSVLILVDDANGSSIDGFVKDNAKKIAHGYIFGGTDSIIPASAEALEKAAPGAEPVTIHFVVPEGATAPADMKIEFDTMVRDSELFNGGAKEWPKLTNEAGESIFWYTDEACTMENAVGPKSYFTDDTTVYGKFLPYFTVTIIGEDDQVVATKKYNETEFKALASDSASPQSSNWNTSRVQTTIEYVTFADLVNDAAGDPYAWEDLYDPAIVTYAAADASNSYTVGQLNGMMFFSDINDAKTGSAMTPCFGINWKSGSPDEGQTQGDVAAKLAEELKAEPSTSQAPRAFVSPTAEDQAEGKTPGGMKMLSGCLSLEVKVVVPEPVTIHFVAPEGATAPADMQIEYDTMVRDSELFNDGAKQWPQLSNSAGESIFWYTDEACTMENAVGPKSYFTDDTTVYGKFLPYFTVTVLDDKGAVVKTKKYSEAEFKALASTSGSPQSSNWNKTRVQTTVEYVTFVDLVNDTMGKADYWAGLHDDAVVTYAAADASNSRTVGELNGALFFSDFSDAETGSAMTPCFGLNWASGAPDEGQTQGDVAAKLAEELKAEPSTSQAPRAFISPTKDEQAEGWTPGGMMMLSGCLSLDVQLTPETVAITYVVPEGYTAPAAATIEYGTQIRNSSLFKLAAMNSTDGTQKIFWYQSDEYTMESAVGPKTEFKADTTLYGKFMPYFTVTILNADGSTFATKEYTEADFAALKSSSETPISTSWGGGSQVQTAVSYVTFNDLVDDAAQKTGYFAGLADKVEVTYAASDAQTMRTVKQLKDGLFYGDWSDDKSGVSVTPCFGLNCDSQKVKSEKQSEVAAQLAEKLAADPFTKNAPRAFVGITSTEKGEGVTFSGMTFLSNCLSLTVQL